MLPLFLFCKTSFFGSVWPFVSLLPYVVHCLLGLLAIRVLRFLDVLHHKVMHWAVGFMALHVIVFPCHKIGTTKPHTDGSLSLFHK